MELFIYIAEGPPFGGAQLCVPKISLLAMFFPGQGEKEIGLLT